MDLNRDNSLILYAFPEKNALILFLQNELSHRKMTSLSPSQFSVDDM